MTISGVFLSVLSGSKVTDPAPPEQAVLRRCEVYRKSFPMTEIALPAYALRNLPVAKWARDQRLAIDLRTGQEFAVAIAAGIHPARMTVHADGMTDSELRATANLEVGRVVVSSMAQIDLLATVGARTQGVFVSVTDVNAPVLAGAGTEKRGFRFDSIELDRAVEAVLAARRLNLIGLHCDVGSEEHDFVSYPAAIGHMITEMTQIRRRDGVVLTRLGLGGGRAVPSGDWAVELPELASQIDESLDDACATMRYPRPLVVLAPGLSIVEHDAA
ncbi:MAG: diaminopimelate decarboxylase [Mycobacterium sp.]|nr:diaminopimelate decarboxylase [Mycobacterium sp.]